MKYKDSFDCNICSIFFSSFLYYIHNALSLQYVWIEFQVVFIQIFTRIYECNKNSISDCCRSPCTSQTLFSRPRKSPVYLSVFVVRRTISDLLFIFWPFLPISQSRPKPCFFAPTVTLFITVRSLCFRFRKF